MENLGSYLAIFNQALASPQTVNFKAHKTIKISVAWHKWRNPKIAFNLRDCPPYFGALFGVQKRSMTWPLAIPRFPLLFWQDIGVGHLDYSCNCKVDIIINMEMEWDWVSVSVDTSWAARGWGIQSGTWPTTLFGGQKWDICQDGGAAFPHSLHSDEMGILTPYH